jgi:hypothetical protein
MRLRKMAEGFICGDFLPSFTLLLTVNMVYDILAKAKNLFIRFFIAIALLLLFLAVGDPTSFIFSSPWEPGLISRKAPSLLSLFKKRKEEEKRNPRGIFSYYTLFPAA